MNFRKIILIALIWSTPGFGEGDVPEELYEQAREILLAEAVSGSESIFRLDAALALLPYSPKDAGSAVVRELEIGEVSNQFITQAVDSLTPYLTNKLLRKARKALKNSPTNDWAIRLLCNVPSQGDLKLIEPYFLDARNDASLIPLLESFGTDAEAILAELLHYSALKSCIAARMLTRIGITYHIDVMERYAESNLCMVIALSEIDSTLARKAAITHLTSEKKETRRSAAASLGRLKDSAYLPYLLDLLADEDSEIRCNAAYSLGFLEDTSGARILREVARDTETFAGDNARLYFDFLPAALVEPVLYPFLKEDWGITTYQAIKAVGIHKDSCSLQLIANLLDNGNPTIVRLALDAIGRIGISSSRFLIYPFLEDTLYQLKEGAILALGGIRDTSAVERLSLMLFWEPYTEGMVVRHPIVDAMIMIGSPDVLPALAEAIDEEDPYLTLKILDFFSRKADASYISYVEKFLTDSLPPLRIRAAAAVLAMRDRTPDVE